MRADKKHHLKTDKKTATRSQKRGVVAYSKKTALLETAITQMNAGKYGRSSAALKDLLALDPHNMEARRLFATLHLRLGSLIPAKEAFDSLINEALERQDYWLAESLLREYLAVGPRCVPFLEQLGSIFQVKGDVLEAVAEYGKAVDALLEDPDPDNPHHVSQLYGKIRDLAPASPIAFRLASFFDAQTGELIARPPTTSGETAVTAPPSSEVEETSAAPSLPEPIAGVMPWEKLEDSPGGARSSPVQVSARPSESPISPEGTEVLLHDQIAGTDISPSADGPMVERNKSGLYTQTEARDEIPKALRPTEPIEALTAEKIPGLRSGLHQVERSSVVPSQDSFEEVPSANRESDSIHSVASDPVPPPPLAFEKHDSLSPQIQQKTVAEVVSAPMPWEDVQESTIGIPDHVPDVPPIPTFPTQGLSTTPLLKSEPSDVYPDEPHGMVSPTPTVAETSQDMSVNEEPIVAPSASIPDQPQAAPPREKVKGGIFSWESMLNSAWKFGEKLSGSAPQPEARQAEEVPFEAPPASTISSLHGPASEAESVDIPEANRDQSLRDSSAPASVATPMPWDQVQESVITIPPAQVEETAAEPPVEQSVQMTSPVEPFLALHQEPVPEEAPAYPLTSPTTGPLATDALPIAEPPVAPMPSESEFRLAGSTPVFSVTEEQATSTAAEPPSSPFAQFSEPPKSVELEPPSFSTTVSGPTDEVVSTEPTDLESIPQWREETIEPVAMAPSSVSSSLSAAVTEVAETENQHEDGAPPLKEENAELAPAPQTMIEAQPVREVEPRIPISPPTVHMPVITEPLAESTQVISRPTVDPAHRSTGEVAVPPQPPSSKKRKRASQPAPEIPVAQSSPEETSHRPPEKGEQWEAAFAEARASIFGPGPQQEGWIKTGESIRLIKEPEAPPVVEPPPQASLQAETHMTQSMSAAAAAVDVLFDSSSHSTRMGTRDRVAESKSRPRLRSKLNRIRIGISVFTRLCFSTTRTIVMSIAALVVFSGALVALGIGAVGLTWIIMEESPSPLFQSLTTSPQRTLSDFKKNGYLLLLGFDAPAEQDPIQAGYERKPDARDADMASTCLRGSDGGAHVGQSKASTSVASGWFRSSDPVGQFKLYQDTIKGWVSRGASGLARYKKWQKLSFEDWGYGQTISPPCVSIVFAQQLYLADGFVQGTDIGVDRLETDMEAWRIALGQAKTLTVKTLALQAINNNIAVASGLLVRSDFDGKYLSRLSKILRPLDQVELSLRWPMQSELVSATKTFEAQLKAQKGEEQALHAVVASVLPLPKQRRLNDYAEYYEASNKVAGAQWKNYIRFPANTVLDYLINPIENIVGLEPLAPWDLYNGLVVDTDAHLRLASLQAWLRRGPQDADLLARMAKAGQNFYDPYTGLPMLVNLKKNVMYSVGHDRKDQDGDPQADLVVMIPVNQTHAVQPKSPARSSKTR